MTALRASLAGFAEIRHRPEWNQWRDLASDAAPFLAPEFFALAAPFNSNRETVVAMAWKDRAMVGALPLVRENHRLLALRCPYTPSYDYRGSLDGLNAIWAMLRADRTWSELVLERIPAESPLATRLPALATADGYPSLVRQDQEHPYFALPEFDRRMSPKFKSNLQRCARKAGGVELERIALPDRAAFDEALAIEAMAWKGAAGTSIDADPRSAHLYRALSIWVGRRHRGALYFLRAGGRRIATMLAVEDGRTLYALKIGYDPSVANLSPGHLLVWKVASEAESRGLQGFDFVGRNDDWKRKWTDELRQHVTLAIYRSDVRGLSHYAMNVLVRPHLPAQLRDGFRSPLSYLGRGCQRTDVLGGHSMIERARGRIGEGFGIRSGIARPFKPARELLGASSTFAPGSWVRVKALHEMRALLDVHGRTRGLLFTGSQWDTVGKRYRVAKHVRRLRDDHGRFRPISRTVLLDGIDCVGDSTVPAGCGRHCPMMYRDEWLEPAAAPAAASSQAGRDATTKQRRHAHVRDLDEILAGLDLHGRRDGLTFMPEMRAYVGRRFTIASVLTRVYEYGRWTEPRAKTIVLEGLQCTGAVVGDRGPCDRACALLWHADWLMLDAETAA